MVPRIAFFFLALVVRCWQSQHSLATAFVVTTASSSLSRTSQPLLQLQAGTTTVEPPTREKTKTERQTSEENRIDDSVNDDDYSDLEYLIDSAESREMDDPFHILLLGSTFDKPKKVTVSYCANSLEYVLSMPRLEAVEQSKFAQDQGLSCLGTWPREECLTLGRQLQIRDLECRVVPYAEGGHRGWQAKDASSSSSSSSSSNQNAQ